MYNFQKIVDELYQQINNARTHPAQLTQIFVKKRQNYNNRYYKINDKSILTIEGVNALNSFINQISITHPMNPLQWSYALHVIADKQAMYIGSQGIQSRQNDSEPLPQRAKQYVILKGRINEITQMGGESGQEILQELLIDDGLESRKRRRALLDPRYRYIGIAANIHKKYQYCTVIILADSICELIKPNQQLIQLSKSKYVNPVDIDKSIKFSRMTRIPQKSQHHIIDQQTLNNSVYQYQKLQQQNPHMFQTFSQYSNDKNLIISKNQVESLKIPQIHDQKVDAHQKFNTESSRNNQLPIIQKEKIIVKDNPDNNCLLF